ncbi:MAG: hypothetical protein KDG54_17840, partial [Geminicoccaceae bacterium]|nr:hypothetical protein [Geminicoccaceae bacterium]
MRIKAWSVTSVRHRNLDPDWHYAGRNVPELPGLRVALRAGGQAGEGYAPFLPHLDNSPAALIETGRNIASAMVNADLTDLDDCVTRLGPCARSLNAARSAVEMALLDLAARARGKSVVQLLGGEARTIEVLRIIPVKSPARMAELAGDYAGQGYRALKLKATGDIDADVERVTAVRAAVGAAIALTVDANQGYDMAGALAFERCLRPLDVWSIEQPVPATDREALAVLRREARVRIEADEGLFTHADLDDVLAREAADSISLKLARSGGLLPSRSMALAATCKGV